MFKFVIIFYVFCFQFLGGRLPHQIVQMGVRFYEVLENKILFNGIIRSKWLTENI